jgi:transposase
MLTFPSALRIYLAVEPVDMRKQFNGLWSLAEEKLQENPRGGAVFVFVGVCEAIGKRPVHVAGGQ